MMMQRPIKLHLCLFTFRNYQFHFFTLIHVLDNYQVLCLDYGGSKANFLINTTVLSFYFRLDMSLLKANKHNVTVFLSLAMIIATFGQTLGAEMIAHSSPPPTTLISNQNSLRSNDESISDKLSSVRHLLKSLFLDWNLGESDFKGKNEETI